MPRAALNRSPPQRSPFSHETFPLLPSADLAQAWFMLFSEILLTGRKLKLTLPFTRKSRAPLRLQEALSNGRFSL